MDLDNLRYGLGKTYVRRILLQGVSSLLVGVFIAVNPVFSVNIVRNLAIIVALIFALAQIADFILSQREEKSLGNHVALALIAVVIVVYLFRAPRLIWNVLGLLSAAGFAFRAGTSFQLAVTENRFRYNRWYLAVISGVIFLAFSIFSLSLPMDLDNEAIRTIGILLISSAFVDLLAIGSLLFKSETTVVPINSTENSTNQ